ncbi:hypothetical protein MAR_005121, partial [Mya arenaria]
MYKVTNSLELIENSLLKNLVGLGYWYAIVFGVKLVFFENSNDNCIWFQIDESILDTKCVFGAIYIPPEGSPYSSIEIFDQIESDIVDFRSEGLLVCMIGDFNARSGLLSDFISVDQHISDELLDIETEILLNKNNLDVLAEPLPVVEEISNDISDDANNVKPTWNPDSLNDFINCIDQESVEQLSLFIDRIPVDGPCTSDLINNITMKTGKILTDAADKCKLFKVKKKQNIIKNYHDCIAQKLKNLRYSKPKEYWCLLNKFSGERKEVLNK